jgi:hypothetical protein
MAASSRHGGNYPGEHRWRINTRTAAPKAVPKTHTLSAGTSRYKNKSTAQAREAREKVESSGNSISSAAEKLSSRLLFCGNPKKKERKKETTWFRTWTVCGSGASAPVHPWRIIAAFGIFHNNFYRPAYMLCLHDISCLASIPKAASQLPRPIGP